MAITKEGSGSPDLPLKSNFVSGALKCLSKRGPEGRGRTTRPTLNTQTFPHGFMKGLLQVTQAPINSANTAPFQMGENMILGWWQICPTLWKLRPEESVSKQPAFPWAHYIKLKQMQQGPGSRLAYSEGPQESHPVSEETGVVPPLAPT